MLETLAISIIGIGIGEMQKHIIRFSPSMVHYLRVNSETKMKFAMKNLDILKINYYPATHRCLLTYLIILD